MRNQEMILIISAASSVSLNIMINSISIIEPCIYVINIIKINIGIVMLFEAVYLS